MPGELRVAYILRSWPRLSQTFILNEVLELERAGVSVTLFPLARADDALVQPQVADVRATVRYLDARALARARMHLAVALDTPGRYLATLVFVLAHRELRGHYTKSNALQAFDAAVQAAWHLRARGSVRCTHVHAHFAHDPAFVGVLVRRLTGLSFTFTAHARDLYQIPRVALQGRAREAEAVVTCCASNARYIEDVIRDTAPVELVYHGVDLRRFHPADLPARGSIPHIVSVGRLIPKKGFDDLLRACAVLHRKGIAFSCEVFGEGPLRGRLEVLRDELGLAGVVRFCGARTQRELLDAYTSADIFALTPCVTEDGDRDGVPNVLLEAMACGLPVVVTRAGGVEEVVRHEVDGLVADARSPEQVARCLELLLTDAALRSRLGAGALNAAQRFDGRDAARRLVALFSHTAPAPAP
ncbi:MAG: glycosyltransferase [Candidatus Dormibacteraeota bacterium]|nr:glycosyltransferase [Candidatus Dormibacteraeota bacterium]MBV9526577.1 glycosyltransferase [Candidatus Dormibacteraeota bacterium]